MEMSRRGENPFDEPTERLKSSDPEKIAPLSGATWEPGGVSGRLLLPVLGGTFEVAWPDITIDGPPLTASFSMKLLSLIYLCTTDGTLPSGTWIAYRELPGGRFYEPVVQRSIEAPLAQAYAFDTTHFAAAARRLGGNALSLGDVSCSIPMFPNVLLAFIVWRGDEEFPARAQVLFDSCDTRHLSAFDLRMGAQEISSRLIKIGTELSGG